MKLSEYDIQFVKGVGEKKARLFNKLGVYSLENLIHYYPRKYLDQSSTVTVANAPTDQAVSIRATMITPVRENRIRKGLTLYKCNFSDGETVIHVTIFNNEYLAKALRTYDEYILYGKVEKRFTDANMSSPQIESIKTGMAIHPIYPATQNLNSKAIAKAVRGAFDKIGVVEDTLNDEIRKKYDLCTLDFALKEIHFPSCAENIEIARKRLIFEELLTLQLGLMLLKSKRSESNNHLVLRDYSDEFYSLLPFETTGAQKRCINDCLCDMRSAHTMNRLIQGDVGSGKTAVAGAVIHTVIKNGYQAAMMAPTEILACQHFESFKKLFDGTGINLALLTGSTKASEKKKIKSQLIDGEIDFVIGTHALIQNDVEFSNLGLVCTDEQHRFGVEQRADLAMKGNHPHLLVMSATPIPRTLGLIIYGELDISVLDELPPNRQEIRTDYVNSSYHERIYRFIKKALDNGRQAYIVCPLIDESESELLAAEEYAKTLCENEFSDYNLGLLHGRMKPKQKDEIMHRFADGEIQILVSTTVIEVGVDVPNATIMLIENADRFGLSQLHQLRGRVGRGKEKSFCILVSDNESEQTKERLGVMKSTSNGFRIAEYDLKTRGPGDFFGKKQHGLPNLKIADMVEDIQTLNICRQCAEEMLKADRRLDSYPLLCDKINEMFKRTDY